MTIRVLAVDDSATFRHWISQTLVKGGIEVETARNATEAREKLAPGHPFDVVVTDLMMPGIDGRKLVTMIQKDEDLEAVPVIVMTASDDQEEPVLNVEAGAAVYFRKPRAVEDQPQAAALLIATVKRFGQQKRKVEGLGQDARTDTLTSLFNRRYGNERLAEQVERFQRYGQGFAVALLDIDHFKLINDTHGHSGGDDVLVRVAAALREASRASDIVVRWGGEEFLFIFPGTDIGQAAGIVERFRNHLPSAPVTVRTSGVEVPVTISGGVAQCEKGDTADGLVARADDALYKAKQAGRNRLLMIEAGRLRPVTAA